MPTHTLMWFRADLRAADNAALLAASRDAAAGGGAVIGLFLLAPSQWAEHDWGGPRVDLVLRTLRVLAADLSALGIPLVVESAPRFADAPRAVVGAARRLGCGAVHWNKEYEVNELARDREVARACAGAGLAVQQFTDQTLAEPGSVLTGEGRPFSVFSPFKRALYRALEEGGGVRVLGRPRRQALVDGAPAPEIPAALPGFGPAVADAETLWPAGEGAAIKRLRTFVVHRLERYKDARDFPGGGGTSAMSPYLAVGAVSPRQCVHAALEAGDGRLDSKQPGPGHWISEVAWREFYKHVLVGFPWVCRGRAFKRDTDAIRWRDDPAQLEAWKAGRTGVPIVDAGMRQLLATGWMHNRVRMITAMYLTKDLFLDWREGERHFMRHLVDGDLACNNGGWQWSASTGTDAAPYFRIFNPVSQSRRFDPEGAYIKRWVPELAGLPGGEDGPVHDPWETPLALPRGLDYPRPLVDRASVKDRVMAAFKALAAG